MKFTKMHGISNDYVYVNCFDEEVKILLLLPVMSAAAEQESDQMD